MPTTAHPQIWRSPVPLAALRRALFVYFFAASTCCLVAADFYVSTGGNDANPGTANLPWRTIQKAADVLAPGDTVYVRAGTYSEVVTVNVSGLDGAPVTFRNFPGENVSVDASGQVPGFDRAGIFLIVNRQHIVLTGLRLENYRTASRDRTPAGVWIEGACRNVRIEQCKISRIANTAMNGNAFGIAAYGTSAVVPIVGLQILRNEISELQTGLSESVALNGNVRDFEVSGNSIHDCNNIGIDFIGYERTCADAALDRARDGVCRDNQIYRISTRNNPSYRGDRSAGGIYCDGADNIVIERNRISRCDIGIELASEAAGGHTSRIAVRDNFVQRCYVTGISLGGYQSRRGTTTGCDIRNNTLYANDSLRTGTGEISLQHNVRSNSFSQNVVFATRQGLMLGSQVRVGPGNIFRRNMYFTASGRSAAMWEWGGKTLDGFGKWKKSARESVAFFANPRLARPTSGDLRLKPVSPAIDKGSPLFVAALGESDIDNQPRVRGARVDLGAHEFSR